MIMEDVILEIHKAFLTSADYTLKKAKRFAKTHKPIEIKSTKDVEFLKTVGFGNVDIVREQDRANNATKEKNFQAAIKLENEKSLTERILELKQSYPDYSVVTYSTIKSICNKYGLVFASSKFYCGGIPNKNIDDLRKFKNNVIINDNDRIFYNWEHETSDWCKTDKVFHDFEKKHLRLYITYEFAEDDKTYYRYKAKIPRFIASSTYCCYELSDFFITAPPHDFDMTGYNNKTDVLVNKIVYAKNNEILRSVKGAINDPIILKPVMGYTHKCAKSMNHDIETHIEPLFLVVTLWGIEKYDPEFNKETPINYN